MGYGVIRSAVQSLECVDLQSNLWNVNVGLDVTRILQGPQAPEDNDQGGEKNRNKREAKDEAIAVILSS